MKQWLINMRNKLLKNKYLRAVLRWLGVKVPPLILCVGDSLTRGSPGNTGYPEYLQQLTGWLTINAGNPGEASNATDARFLGELKKYRPDLVLLCIGTNDHTLGIKPEFTQGYIQNMVNTAACLKIKTALIATPEYSGSQPHIKLNDNPIYAGIYHAHVFAGALLGVMNQPGMLADSVHLTEPGYCALAQHIADEVKAAGLVE